jgi:hypothetical protein
VFTTVHFSLYEDSGRIFSHVSVLRKLRFFWVTSMILFYITLFVLADRKIKVWAGWTKFPSMKLIYQALSWLNFSRTVSLFNIITYFLILLYAFCKLEYISTIIGRSKKYHFENFHSAFEQMNEIDYSKPGYFYQIA